MKYEKISSLAKRFFYYFAQIEAQIRLISTIVFAVRGLGLKLLIIQKLFRKRPFIDFKRSMHRVFNQLYDIYIGTMVAYIIEIKRSIRYLRCRHTFIITPINNT